jgi:hypothetical protein
MTKAEQFLKTREKNRPKVLSDDVREYAISLTKNKRKAKAFMKEAGILDSNGKLTPQYK